MKCSFARRSLLALFAMLGLSLLAQSSIARNSLAQAAEVQLAKGEDGVKVSIDGKPFTQYLIKSGNKPILWPIIGPTGVEMTRQYPMKTGNATEKSDHPHQRSLWFTHGNVNGVSFWDEKPTSGFIKHKEFVKVESGEKATIVTRNDWTDVSGKKICEDERTLQFSTAGDARIIDFTVTVTASEGKLTFGDTKEGSFGVRVPGVMDVDAKKGGKIVNSNGETDAKAWAKRASWVDYHGPVEGETVGIAILNHPSSFRYPTYWHVRTYGLFAANPFGVHDFLGKDSKESGDHVMQKGEKMTLRYRVIFHKGDEQAAKIAEAFKGYAEEK